MNDQQPRNFIRRVYCTTALLVAVVSLGLVIARQWRFLGGFVAGAAIAALMLYSVVLVSSAMTGQAQARSSPLFSGRKVVAVQVGKYAVVIGALYVLTTFTQVSGAGIAVGYGTHLAVLLLIGATMARRRQVSGEDTMKSSH